MRNTFKTILLAAITILFMASCTKEDSVKQTTKTILKLNVDYPSYSGNNTKITKKGWDDGDKMVLYFSLSKSTGYDYTNGVELEKIDGKWCVIYKEFKLDEIENGSGYVIAIHTDHPSGPWTNYEYALFQAKDSGTYTAYSSTPGTYTKADGVISISGLKLVPYDEFQFNIKLVSSDVADISFSGYDTYFCGFTIYNGTNKVVTSSFASAIIDGNGFRFDDTGYLAGRAGLDASVKECRYYLSFRNSDLSYTMQTQTDGTQKRLYKFGTDPIFELVYSYQYQKPDETWAANILYVRRTVPVAREILNNSAYSINGPLKTPAEINELSVGSDLGNNWTLFKKE